SCCARGRLISAPRLIGAGLAASALSRIDGQNEEKATRLEEPNMKRSVGLVTRAALLLLLCPAAAQTPADRSDSAPPQSLIQDLVAANRILYHQGIVHAYHPLTLPHPSLPAH